MTLSDCHQKTDDLQSLLLRLPVRKCQSVSWKILVQLERSNHPRLFSQSRAEQVRLTLSLLLERNLLSLKTSRSKNKNSLILSAQETQIYKPSWTMKTVKMMILALSSKKSQLFKVIQRT